MNLKCFLFLNIFFNYFYHFFRFLHYKKCKLKTYFLILWLSVFHKAIYTRQYVVRTREKFPFP
jgi:hypothetical protein